ncbi:MAG: HAD family hydrolase [Nanoarchaeota archaeon]|nr:HAD family hydrolase [Nanoarchaeota archaeon]
MKTRQDAQKLLEEWVSSESLRRHCLGVATCMEVYAMKYVEDGKLGNSLPTQPLSNINNNSGNGGGGNDNQAIIDKWYICGLLHDFDWEKYPDIDLHPKKGCEFLKENDYDNSIIEAILGHNAKTGVKRKSLMAKCLFAVDELSGLVVALARVRPGNFEGMSAKSVRKAMKKKDFAAAISREDIKQGMEELEVDENEHFELIISALTEIKKDLGF